jgi:hypothetical protein
MNYIIGCDAHKHFSQFAVYDCRGFYDSDFVKRSPDLRTQVRTKV